MSLVDDTRAFFSAHGPIAELLDGYEPRAEQLQMAEEVAACLQTPGRRLLVEAGTGTGKSLAYLVPAFLSNQKVLVSTGTKALQDQLFEKDIPLVLEALHMFRGVEKTAVLVKGRNNYLCLNRFEAFAREPLFAFVDDARHFDAIEHWAQHTTTGDRAEVDGLPDLYVPWSDFDASSESCIGRKCPAYQDCFVTRMRHAAEKADVVVANHHLVCADLRLRLEGLSDPSQNHVDDDDDEMGFSFAKVLPDSDAVLIDEAHALPEVATSYFGVSFTPTRVDRYGKDLRRALADLDDSDATLEVGDALATINQQLNRLDDRLEPFAKGNDRVRLQKSERTDAVQKLGAAVEDAFFTLADILNDLVEREGDDSGIGANFLGLQRRAEQFGAEVGFITSQGIDDERFVSWVEQNKRGSGLAAAPIDVSDALRKTLFAGRRPVVLTSATLAVGDSTRAYEERIGLKKAKNVDEANIEDALPSLRQPVAEEDEDGEEEEHDDEHDDDEHDDDVALSPVERALQQQRRVFVDRLLLPSPFAYDERAALYAPKGMPAPTAPGYVDAFDDEVKHLLALSQGGALLLFTSHRAMNEAHERLQSFMMEARLEPLLQGDAPKLRLLERMLEVDELSIVDEDADVKGAVLFATQSFWEGVDLRGRALRLVVIDRLPFKSPADPLNQARLELAESRGQKPFFDLSVPEAALSLKQGAGRLMRDVHDAGVVAILDGRLRQKSYGRTFLNTLPPFLRIGSQQGVARFWEARVQPWLSSALDVDEDAVDPTTDGDTPASDAS